MKRKMTIFLKAGGQLRAMLKPDVDHYTRKVDIESGKTIGEILKDISLDPAYVALIYVDGKMKDLSFKPSNGQTITLQPPVSGG
jgi:molybdopterin converting factor small subunit